MTAENSNEDRVSTTVTFETGNAKEESFGVSAPHISPYGAVISLSDVPADYTHSKITITPPIGSHMDPIELTNHTTELSGLEPLTEYTVEAIVLSDTDPSIPIETKFTTQELTRYVLDNDANDVNSKYITIITELTGQV